MTRHACKQEAVDQWKCAVADIKTAMKRAGLPAALREMLVGILQHWRAHHRGPIHPGTAAMAKWATLGRRQAQRHIDTLENWRFLTPIAHEEGGRGQATVYFVDLRALVLALDLMGGRPSEFLRFYCGVTPVEKGDTDPDFSDAGQCVTQSDVTLNPDAEAAGSRVQPHNPVEVSGGEADEAAATTETVTKSTQKGDIGDPEKGDMMTPRKAPPLGGALYGTVAPRACAEDVGATSQPPLLISRSWDCREEEGQELSVPREAGPPILPRPVDPQLDPTAPHGRTPDGSLRTWTGRPVSPEQWARLSWWERHGTAGLIFDALAGCWRPGCICT